MTVKTVIQQVLGDDTDKVLLESFPRPTKKRLEDCKTFTSMLFDNPALINSFKDINDDEFLQFL